MAKMIYKNKRARKQESKKGIKSWALNKIKLIRKTAKPLAARASRWGGPSGITLVFFLLISSLLYPKDEIQILKWHLLNNPNELETHLALAEKLLGNNQFEETEKLLLLAQEISNSQLTASQDSFGIPIPNSEKNILGQQSNSKLDELWQKKYYSDPKDIKKIIEGWEKIIQEKPNYRDAYFQLAVLNYKIYEEEKAKLYLKKVLEIDPNFEKAKELEKIITHH